ncbi:hypothetical protein SAMN05443582_1064 [Phyllobacterium sp. OV277]|nr:hypothetical protein SAMN05443582_1064 [Phyllobacterium sp. OV277]
MRMQTTLPVTLILAVAFGTIGPTLAQTKNPVHTLKCWEGGNRLEFSFDGKGNATLTQLAGPAITLFEDLKDPQWTVRTVSENGVPRIHIANKHGALLSIYVARKTLGQLTWNNPAGSKADVLCDVDS